MQTCGSVVTCYLHIMVIRIDWVRGEFLLLCFSVKTFWSCYQKERIVQELAHHKKMRNKAFLMCSSMRKRKEVDRNSRKGRKKEKGEEFQKKSKTRQGKNCFFYFALNCTTWGSSDHLHHDDMIWYRACNYILVKNFLLLSFFSILCDKLYPVLEVVSVVARRWRQDNGKQKIH